MGKSYWEWTPVFKLNPTDSALLVIDMQNGFIEEDSPLEVPMARKQVPVIRELITSCRNQEIPVIYTSFCIGPDNHYDFYWKMASQRGLKIVEPHCEFWDGKHETKIYPGLNPHSSDRVIKKAGYDCFAGTELDQILKSLDISTLMITGTMLNWCVDSTVRAAYHRHYNVAVISDGVSSIDEAGGTAEDWQRMELNLFAEAFGRVLSSNEAMKELINQAPVENK